MKQPECYRDKFHPREPQCPNQARWKSRGAGNFTDEWTWCDEHAPSPEYREELSRPARE